MPVSKKTKREESADKECLSWTLDISFNGRDCVEETNIYIVCIMC